MFLPIFIGIFVTFFCFSHGGVVQVRERRSEERCGRDYEQTGPGSVELPTEEYNGTAMYSQLSECDWNIKTTEGTYILMTSVYFAVEESEDCLFLDHHRYLCKQCSSRRAVSSGSTPFAILFLSDFKLKLLFASMDMSKSKDGRVHYRNSGVKGFIKKFWDYVEITDRGEHPVINRFCGWDPVTYISASNDVSIRFHSDESYEDKGFIFNFEPRSKDSIGSSQCNSSIRGPNPGEISGTEAPCFYNIRASEGNVIELDLTERDFGGRPCEEENVKIFKGFSGQGAPLVTICGDTTKGFIGVREPVFFIEYHKYGDEASNGFKIQYKFVLDTFTPAPPPVTTPSPVGGDNDCSHQYINPENGVVTYTSPTFQDNRHCVVVVRNTLLRNHLVEITFDKFDLEESDDCMFDSLKILAGEREDSAMLGGKHGKLYCGKELQGRTFITQGNSLRLNFVTDESLSFYGFQATIKFVHGNVCDCKQRNAVCVRTGFEKQCVLGTKCPDSSCQNGGKCVRRKGKSENECICQTGFSGTDCSEGQGQFEILHFTIVPENRELVRESSHTEECQAKVVDSDALISYTWTLDGETISPFTEARGFGTEPGGLLRIQSFNDQLEGTYSCIASTESGTSIEHFFEYHLIEECPAGIVFGPKDEEKKVGEEVLLPCYAPTAVSVVWKKDDRLIDFDHETRFEKKSNNYLHVIQLEELDSGVYRCEAKSRTGCYGYREGKLSVLDVKPLNSYCGRTIYDEEISSRISMGRAARPAEYPWHVILRGIKSNGAQQTFCGGSLISQRWVITAAHCVTKFPEIFQQDFGPNTVKLYLGAEDCFGTQGIIRQPANVIIHDNFNKFAYMDNDIALIELSSPVEYTLSVIPICIEPDKYNDKVFFGAGGKVMLTYGKVAGCGQDWQSAKSTELMEIRIPYVDRDVCQVMFDERRRKPAKFMFTDQMICAGNEVKRTGDTCKGDSGGALVMTAQNRWVQTGIVSFGIGCDKGFYGVYTNVGRFYDWIKARTGFDSEFVDS